MRGAGPRASRATLLDDALARQLGRAMALDRRQLYGLEMLRARPACGIAEIARDLGWSRKHFAYGCEAMRPARGG
ncbi:hypothetical protein [Lichenicoccus sp.]|uniref:hypothetical protein n=1 Tax=Lichenicoccus sp. TaxID=2781899 RepID=UPI003D145F7A